MSTDPDASPQELSAAGREVVPVRGGDRAADTAGEAAWLPDDPVLEARVLRAFIRDRRLVSIPARDRKKLVVYRYLVDQVLPDPGEVVVERELNMRLALWYPDVATIRRALIDHRLAARDGMAYRRLMPARRGAGSGSDPA